MRWLFLIMTMSACGGADDVAVDAEYDVTITNVLEQCHSSGGQETALHKAIDAAWTGDADRTDFCGCVDEDGTDCSDVVDRNSESYRYGLIQSGDSYTIFLDGEEFAQGARAQQNCRINYESPVWLSSPEGGDVQWKIEVEDLLVDTNGSCKNSFPAEHQNYDFLGIEKVVVVGSDNDAYPIGRTVWKVISGERVGG